MSISNHSAPHLLSDSDENESVSLTVVGGLDDDTAKHRTLHKLGIFDTTNDDRFERITRVAKRALNVTIAYVCLVDDEEHFSYTEPGQSSRLFAHRPSTNEQQSSVDDIANETEAFIIEDAATDERYKNSPLVTGDPYIRFYAECPIIAGDGSRLGTLCAIDHKPRVSTAEDLELLKDVAALVERELAAVYLATVDELTGIANRRGFFTMAKQYMQISLRQELPMSLVFFDLNDFKTINDNFGHAEGDRALRDFASILKNSMRGSDFVSRLGGDEFVVLLNDALPTTVQSLIERTMAQIDDYNDVQNRGYNVDFSAGIVAFDPQLHESIETLLEEGDRLMYQNKQKDKALRT